MNLLPKVPRIRLLELPHPPRIIDFGDPRLADLLGRLAPRGAAGENAQQPAAPSPEPPPVYWRSMFV